MTANTEIRQAAAEAGLKLWQLADVYGVTDGNFSRKLRHELPAEDKERLLNYIEEVKNHVRHV